MAAGKISVSNNSICNALKLKVLDYAYSGCSSSGRVLILYLQTRASKNTFDPTCVNVTNLCRRCIEEHAVESIHKSQDDIRNLPGGIERVPFECNDSIAHQRLMSAQLDFRLQKFMKLGVHITNIIQTVSN